MHLHLPQLWAWGCPAALDGRSCQDTTSTCRRLMLIRTHRDILPKSCWRTPYLHSDLSLSQDPTVDNHQRHNDRWVISQSSCRYCFVLSNVVCHKRWTVFVPYCSGYVFLSVILFIPFTVWSYARVVLPTAILSVYQSPLWRMHFDKQKEPAVDSLAYR